MVDVATVNAVSTAATAQPATAAFASGDAGFGALLQALSGDSTATGALIATPNTTALPITNFAAATLMQNTVVPDKASDAAMPAASALWTPAAVMPIKLASAFGDAPPAAQDNRPAQDTKNATPSDSTDSSNATPSPSDATTGLLALWLLAPQAAPTMPAAGPQQAPQQASQQTLPQTLPQTAPQTSRPMAQTAAVLQTSQPVTPTVAQQVSTATTLAASDTATPGTAATGGSSLADRPTSSDQTDQTGPSTTNTTAANKAASDQAVSDQAAADQAVSDQAAANLSVANSAPPDQSAAYQVIAQQTVTNPATSNPTASASTVNDQTVALAATQALAAPRETDGGTADFKPKAKSRGLDEVKSPADKSKSTAADMSTSSDKALTSDKTGADKAAGIATADSTAGPKHSPIQPVQDGQSQGEKALNGSSPGATAAQATPVVQPDSHSSAAKADAGTAQVVAASPLASEPPKVTADLQVAARQQGDTSSASLDKLGVTIAAKTLQGLHEFNIRLDPPDLGRVQVKLTVDDAGQAQASLVVDKPQTLDLLQRDSSSLNRVLTDAGLNLSNNGLSFSLRDQQQQADGGTAKGRSRNLSVKAALAAETSTIRSTSGSYAPNSVRLDIRV